MTDSELDGYNRAFQDIIHSFEDFINSKEFSLLSSEDRHAPAAVIKTLGQFITRKLKDEDDPEKLLTYIEAIDKLYFQCLMKNEICASMFETLYAADKDLFSRQNIHIPGDLKKELDAWVENHGRDIFTQE